MKLLSNGLKEYKGSGYTKVVLDSFSFDIQMGCTVIMGPNGCGKSTMFKILLGLEKLSSGKLDYAVSKHDLFSAVLQNYQNQLLMHCSIKDNILISASKLFNSKPNQVKGSVDSVLSALNEFGYALNPNNRAATLSGGEKQALVVARSFLGNPEVWILDEPVSAVDFRRRAKILESIRIKGGGSHTIITTHDINDAILIGSRLIVFGHDMQVLVDERLPKFDDLSIQKRLDADWARLLRRKMLDLTHYLPQE